ncbi:MAG TPA: VOC family protein [Candidatus Methylomirabilis sp.]|nr:VOC family protein [Candidatus Methylomirabilis sp.]
MPALTGIVETALYVDDIERASRFYEEILGLRRIDGDDRLRAYSVADRDVLLLFKRGATTKPIHVPAGMIPPHDGSGQNHFALAIAAAELPAWEKQLAKHAIAIESRVHWPRGGTSIYFRDPDGNLVELATPGMWSIY